jgi:hypothetical protein
MKKLDRLGWAAGISLAAYGVRIGVRVSDPQLLARVAACLPPAWRPAPARTVERLYSLVAGGQGLRPGVRRFNLLYANAERIARAAELDDVLGKLETDLRLYVAAAARQMLFVQAGVVGFDNQAVVILGRALTGRTTLVAELVRAGAEYYSDDYAVVDWRGRVHPYPRPLDVKGKVGVKPLPVAMVVLSRFRPGARWRPRRLSSGHAVLEVLANTLSARRHPALALARLNKAITHARVFKGVRGEARETARLILESLCR